MTSGKAVTQEERSLENRETAIKTKARELGYDGCGIIAAAPFQEFLAGVEIGRAHV